MSGASADAVVNAPVVTVRSWTAGTLSLPERELGAYVQKSETLASVTDSLVDRIRLDDLLLEVDLAKAETARTAANLAATQGLRDELLTQAETFHTARVEELQVRLDHARNRLALLDGTAGAGQQATRTLAAVADQPDRLPGEPYADKLVLDHARERVELLEIALRTAEQGVFLGDGYNDSPNSEQQASELAKVIGTLEAELAEDKAREAAFAGRLSRERVRVNGLSGGDLTAPVNGLFWEVLEADGVTVQRGDPVLRLVNCDAMMVTLSVTERIYNTLAIGQDAEFRLSGSSQVLPATVSRLAGSGAATVYEHLAVAPSQKHLERYDVALNVPGLGQGSESACAIGRTGRAFFERRPLDWLRSVFD